MLEFKSSVVGSKPWHFRIVNFGASLADWRDAWPRVTDVMRDIQAQQFEGQGGRGQRDAWAPLSDAYARRKQKQYPGRPILQASTRLWQSLAGKTADTVEEYGPLKLGFGTRVEYAAFLNSGTGKGIHKTGGVPTGRGTGRGMAQRVIFDLMPQDQMRVAKEMERQGSEMARRAGFGLSSQGGGSAGALASQQRIGGATMSLSEGI